MHWLNWENYLIRDSKIKQEKFEKEANILIEKYNATFSFDEVCYYIDKMNLNLPVKLNTYVYYDELIEDYVDYSSEIDHLLILTILQIINVYKK